ncbi:MAG: FHA domain-containing protein [Deltaproteobacteria bacterium]|nr:FHA domain-containing protein [Deltaproteobacteria bacterium]MBW2722803.1 FHA domain-containing protein [Deltaproteobacteria bacterium]
MIPPPCLLAGLFLLAIGAAATLAETVPEADEVQRVYLDEIVPRKGENPAIQLYLRAESSSGRAVTRPDPSRFSIRDNGTPIEPAEIEITTIGQARLGTAAVLILDSSRSMRGQPFDRAKQAALAQLDQMGELDEVGVVSFNDEVEVVGDFGTPRETLRERIAALSVQKKTLAKRVWDAVDRGLELIDGSREALPQRIFIIVFSDGRDSGSDASPSSLLDAAAGDPNRARIPIFSVGFMGFGSAGLAGLDRLSQGTGAAMYPLHSQVKLDDVMDKILSRMTQSLVVSYPAQFDGERHTVEVRVDAALDSRQTGYPAADDDSWRWAAAVIPLLLIGGLLAATIRMRNLRPSGELVIASGSQADRRFALARRRVDIGALDDNDIVLNNASVSRHHARLTFEPRGTQLEDLSSKNGTFINDRRIYSKGSIRPGDRIRVGNIELIFRA